MTRFRPDIPFSEDVVEAHKQCIPQIEDRIRKLNPHTIVCGVGPSAYMLPLIDQSLLTNVRIWGVNDFWRVMDCHDLVLMDGPVRELRPEDNPRYDWIKQAKPQRAWLYSAVKNSWDGFFPDAKRHVFDLNLWHPGRPHAEGFKAPVLQGRPYHHTIASPVGTVAIAWGEGNRRIGFIGVDLLSGHHKLSDSNKWIKWFLKCFMKQADALGGKIMNLSPLSTVGCHPATEQE